MIRIALAIAAVFSSSAAIAASADEENAKDMRCLIVASELAESTDKEVEMAGLITAQYYLGRIDGRSPGADLEKLLEAEAVKLTDEDRPRLLEACGKQIEARGKHLEAVGAKLDAGS